MRKKIDICLTIIESLSMIRMFMTHSSEICDVNVLNKKNNPKAQSWYRGEGCDEGELLFEGR